jgi:tetratricopeptide (TPR) repeat protein
VTTPTQRSARAALDAARPAVARLDASRGPEDLAADLIETWSAAEAALRLLVGSTILTGQSLIREARSRQMINFDQANALAEFHAVHDRLQNTSYQATDSDVDAGRSAFIKLDSALMGDSGMEPPRAPTGQFGSGFAPRPSSQPAPVPAATTPTPSAAPPLRVIDRIPRWGVSAILAGVVVVIAIVAFFAFGHGGSDALQQGVDAYQAGQREAAVNAFTKAAREDPRAALPHIYLARMAREVGNFPLASQELDLALQRDPTNALALREMGANLLAQGNYELARRFYVRAVQADPTDKSAMGYLGCTLMHLNRVSEATNFLNRAGPGPWTNCTPSPVATPPANPAAITGQPAPVGVPRRP